jgi:hypothetical protein
MTFAESYCQVLLVIVSLGKLAERPDSQIPQYRSQVVHLEPKTSLHKYLSYSNRHADLLFELISRRYEHKSTVITTNRAFKEWHEVFPNAACVVSLIDRLVHRCEIVAIEGESYRLKEAKARSEKKAATRAAVPRKGKTP